MEDSLTASLSNAPTGEFEEMEDDDSNTTDNNRFSTSENGDSLHLARIVENENKNDNDNDNDEDTDCGLIDNAFGTSYLLRKDGLHSLEDLGSDIFNIDNGSLNSAFGIGNCNNDYGYSYDSQLSAESVLSIVLDDGGKKSNNTKTTTSRAVLLVRIITMVDIKVNINVTNIYNTENKEILDDCNNDVIDMSKIQFLLFFACCNTIFVFVVIETN